MKPLALLAVVLMWLTLGTVLSACSGDEVGGDYYENELHGGYPGPATRSPRNDR